MRWVVILTISLIISNVSSVNADDAKVSMAKKSVPHYIYSLSSYMEAVKNARNLKELIPYVTNRQKTVILAAKGKKAKALFNWLRVCTVENPKIAFKSHRGNKARVILEGTVKQRNGKVSKLNVTYILFKENDVWKVDHPINRRIVQRKKKRSSLRVKSPIKSSQQLRTK